ncbi:hypothetical protein F4823DRAFT_386208 [Ustulina deusta]|nr:hypothetical protein F4823DRAFT_386208 [Ustulina deusta]
MCCCWLNAINMPVREIDNAVTATKTSQRVSRSEDTIGILDFDDEYDIYKGDDGCLGSAASSTVVENPCDKFLRSQQFSSVPLAPVAMIQEQKSVAAERTENALIQPGQDTNASTPARVVTQTRQDNNADLSQEEVDLAVQETRLIMELQTTNERTKREKLVTELSELLKRSENLTQGVKANQSRRAFQGNSSGATDDEVISTLSFTEAEARAAREREDEEKRLAQERVEMAIIKEQREIKLQEGLEKDSLHLRREGEGIARRQTPPHLRGICVERRS